MPSVQFGLFLKTDLPKKLHHNIGKISSQQALARTMIHMAKYRKKKKNEKISLLFGLCLFSLHSFLVYQKNLWGKRLRIKFRKISVAESNNIVTLMLCHNAFIPSFILRYCQQSSLGCSASKQSWKIKHTQGNLSAIFFKKHQTRNTSKEISITRYLHIG